MNKKIIKWSRVFVIFLSLSGFVNFSEAAEVTVALASNFVTTFKDIASGFEKDTGHRIILISGSTGKIFSQIMNGAPFEVFLSADSMRPKRLEKIGLAVQGSRFSYAVGRLALWSPGPIEKILPGPNNLSSSTFKYLAIANPKTSPYGKAAKQTLVALKLWEILKSRIVQGENISQTFQFVVTGNAEWGLVALSQVLGPKIDRRGVRWDVPLDLHEAINQEAVLLVKGQNNPAAHALLGYLKDPKALLVIKKYGYVVKKISWSE